MSREIGFSPATRVASMLLGFTSGVTLSAVHLSSGNLTHTFMAAAALLLTTFLAGGIGYAYGSRDKEDQLRQSAVAPETVKEQPRLNSP